MVLKKKINLFILLLLFLTLLTILCSPGFADGLIIIPRPPDVIWPSNFPLEIRYHHVTAQLTDATASTTVDQEFYNPTERRLEGTYLFPIPKGAVISKFSMNIDGKEVAAEMLDATKARQIYEDIVRKELDPALLEYSGSGLYKARIFPIEPHAVKRVKITYHEILEQDNGTYTYTYSLNTEKFSARNLRDLSINVNIHSGSELKNIYSPSLPVTISRHGDNDAVVNFTGRDLKPDRDFKLYYDTNNSKFGLSMVTNRQKGENGYFLINLTPTFNMVEHKIAAKDITFLLDNSGSMNGEKLIQAKKALLFCIKNLNANDRFQIIRFGTEAEALFQGLVTAGNKQRQLAIDFVQDINAIGGTNLEEALKLARLEEIAERPHYLILITDGKPTIGETDEQKLLDWVKKRNPSHTRIFTFGIGYDLNTHLLDKITELTKADHTYITPGEDLERKITDFYMKVQSPALNNPQLTVSGNISIHRLQPLNLPDLFHGSTLTVLGQYQGSDLAVITLSGEGADGQKRQFNFQVNFPEVNRENDFVPALWAARRIGYLLEQIRLHGEEPELVDEVTVLARKYGIITPYTSYLILEDESNRVMRHELDSEAQTLGSLPAASDLSEKTKAEYKGISKKSGEESVRSSQELRSLNTASGVADLNQGQSRLDFKDEEGKTQNLTQNMKYLQGRAFYYSGRLWVDEKLQSIKGAAKIRIQFASAQYFNLLHSHPEIAVILALDKNLRFVLEDKVYEIYE